MSKHLSDMANDLIHDSAILLLDTNVVARALSNIACITIRYLAQQHLQVPCNLRPATNYSFNTVTNSSKWGKSVGTAEYCCVIQVVTDRPG